VRFTPGQHVTLEHSKPWKRTTFSSGVVESHSDGVLRILRTFKPGGRYDTLGDRILPGDHGVVEVVEGGWVLRRAYFRADGRLLGELYNIQTPVELLPGRVRYMDLEVDVVQFPDGRVEVVDVQDLETVVKAGAIRAELADKALRIASRLADTLREGGDWREVTEDSE
jgi:hypothetical protein